MRGLELGPGDRFVGIVGFAAEDGVDLAGDDEGGAADGGADDGAVLGMIINDLQLTGFDFLAAAVDPWLREDGEGFELVAWSTSVCG